jgi:phage gp36-like protein
MYATLADILEQVAESELISLTDDEQLDAVDQTVIDRAIANAMTLIDAHCGDRYTVPFDPVPPLVRMYAVDLAVYNLYSRRTHVPMPEVIGERQKQTLSFLRQVQKGDASIGIPLTAAVSSESSSALIPGNERLFSRKNMRGL